jgi:SAM-dependent methyltransferase
LEPHYHYDSTEAEEIVHQPEAYEVVRYLLGVTGRGTVIDIGCGNGRKLRDLPARQAIGVDYGTNVEFCRANYRDFGQWVEADLSNPNARLLANHANSDSIVICADVIEHIPDPTTLLRLLEDCYRRGAIVITTTPDRVRVRGPNHLGPPPNDAHVREWELDEYARVITDAGLSLTFAGYTINNTVARELKTILTISDPDLSSHSLPRNDKRPLAILAAYNEADIVDEVISDWLSQGCDVHLIDNWSKDGTWDAARRWAAAHPARVSIERFPDVQSSTYEWIPILNRKADIAARHPGRWIIHTDADELRRSPFPGVILSDALDLAAHTGSNRVDFRVINFQPAGACEPIPGNIQNALRRFDFGTRPGHLKQSKAWLQGRSPVDLASTGGHEVRFAGAVDFRYKFLLKHYPIRSQRHARQKIEHERHARRSAFETEVLGWHNQYERLIASDFAFESTDTCFEWCDEKSWKDYGLLVMTDLISSRLRRGWIEAGR